MANFNYGLPCKTFVEGRGYVYNFQLLQEREELLDKADIKPLDVLFNQKHGKLANMGQISGNNKVVWKTKEMTFEDVQNKNWED